MYNFHSDCKFLGRGDITNKSENLPPTKNAPPLVLAKSNAGFCSPYQVQVRCRLHHHRRAPTGQWWTPPWRLEIPSGNPRSQRSHTPHPRQDVRLIVQWKPHGAGYKIIYKEVRSGKILRRSLQQRYYVLRSATLQRTSAMFTQHQLP